jgi:hypothetical protein
MTSDAANDPEYIAALFTGADGTFRFARWGRPLAPVVYGTNDEGIRIFEQGLRQVATLAGLETIELDPELGANFLVFFVAEWSELTAVPQLEKLIPGVGKLATTLAAEGANQYRVFGFDDEGAIRVCITLLRYDDTLKQVSAQTLAVSQSLMGILLWSRCAFDGESPVMLAAETGLCMVKPWHASLVRAAYDPVIPAASAEPALALRLAARIAVMAEADA